MSIICPVCQNTINEFGSYCIYCNCPMDQIIANNHNNKEWKSKDFLVNGGLLKRYNGLEKTIIIPPSVRRIDFSVFYNSDVEIVLISNNVISISARSFSNCNNLHTLIIGKNVKYIGGLAFSNCHKLKTIVFWGHEKIDISNNAFNGCDSIERVLCISENSTLDMSFLSDALDLSKIEYIKKEDVKKTLFFNPKLELDKSIETKTNNDVDLNNIFIKIANAFNINNTYEKSRSFGDKNRSADIIDNKTNTNSELEDNSVIIPKEMDFSMVKIKELETLIKEGIQENKIIICENSDNNPFYK